MSGAVFNSGRWSAWCSSPAAAWALVVLCLGVYLPGFFSIPAVDRDEARFAQASRQMAESGDWVVPRIQDRARLNKPPLIYWLQASSVGLFTGGDIARDRIWMYRVPSLIAAIVVVLLTRRIGLAMFDPRAAVLGAAFIAVAPVFLWEARQARADMVLVACTTGAMLGLWLIVSRGATTARQLLLWGCVALGVLVKGPVTPLVVVLGAVVFTLGTRRYRWLIETAPLFGLSLLAAVVVPWQWIVTRRVSSDVLTRTAIDETLGRALSPMEGHAGPPGFHTLLVWVLLFPGCLCLGAALVLTVKGWWRAFRFTPRTRTLPARPEWFLIAWAGPSWIMFEIVATKLPHYTMPLYPALALLAARFVLRPRLLTRRVFSTWWGKFAARAWMLGAVVFASAGVAVFAYSLRSDSRPLLGAAAGLLGVPTAALLYVLTRRSWLARRLTAMHTGGIALAGVGGMLICAGLPRLPMIWTSRSVVGLLSRHDPAAARPIAAVGFEEDSLIFETRGRARRVREGDLAAWLERNPGALIVIEERLLNRRPELKSLGGTLGFNYSKGQRVLVAIAEARP